MTLASLFETPSGIIRLGVGVLVGVVVLLFWVQTVLVHFTNAVTTRNAQELLEAGQTQAGVDLYFDAVDRAPDEAINRLRVSQAIFQASSNDPDIENKLTLIGAALEQIELLLDRNPLDHRAWSRLGEYEREMAIVQGDLTSSAVRGNQTLVGLMPGFWQAWAALSFAYSRIGDHELAASVADEAISISNGVPESSFVYYLKAASLESLGRFDEAVEAANQSIQLRDNAEAHEVLARIASLTDDSS